MCTGEKDKSAGQASEAKPLWLEDYPISPLSTEEQAPFQGLTWVSPPVRDMEYPDPDFGVIRIVIGDSSKITVITPDEKGNLVKRVVSQENKVAIGLGGGPSVPERTVYTNDNFVVFGPAYDITLERRVFFQDGVSVNDQTILSSIALAEEFQVVIQQDKASRTIKQAQIDLMESLGIASKEPAIAALLTESLERKMNEAAVESGLIQTSREELPEGIRILAGKMEEVGIKCIQYGANRITYWPDGIKQSWTLETDNYSRREWERDATPLISRT